MAKKMKVADLQPKGDKQKPSNEQQKKAIADLDKMRTEAEKTLDEMADVNEFAMQGQCADKDGNQTKVLVIDLDKEGYLGVFMELGNPYSLSPNTGNMEEDGKKMVAYLNFMSNIDLKDTANQKQVGARAISKARGLVSDFFTLQVVSNLRTENVMVSQ